MSFIHEESQTAQDVRPIHIRQSQTTQTSVAETELDNLTHFSFIPRSSLLEALLEMDVARLSSLCRSLHIDSLSPVESLRAYSDRLDPQKYLFFLRLLNPVEVFDHSHRHPETEDPALIKRFDLGFRFRSEFAASVLAGPFFVGDHPYSETFSLKLSKQTGRRVLVQSVCQSDVSFPKSLTIWIGDTKVVSGHTLRSCRVLDLTNLVVGETRVLIEVRAQFEGQWFCMVIRQAEEIPLDKLRAEVLGRRLEGESESSLCCAISKKVMKVPVRSRSCRHGQCVELKALLTDGLEWGELVCPVCGETVQFDDLAIDWTLMERLAAVRVRKQYSILRKQDLGL
jgi:hypothetical protein